MASTTVKPYPHVQINVKDNSIAQINLVETLPVHRPLYVMKTQKGPIGRPVWCNTYSEAAAIFGAETFNPANKDYYSKAAAFLKETLTNNGTFISRYLPIDYNKVYTYVNSKTGKTLEGTTPGSGAYITRDKSLNGQPVPERILLAEATANTVLYALVKEKDVVLYKVDGSGDRVKKADPETLELKDILAGKAKGVSIQFGKKNITEFYVDQDCHDPELGVDLKPTCTAEGWVFPLVAVRASDPGAYGNDLAFQLFYTPKSNDPGDVGAYKTLFYNIGFAAREYNSTTWDPIVDIYNRENCAFAINPETINPDTGASLDIKSVLEKGFSDSTHQLPVDLEICEKNFNLIGLIIAAYENDATAIMYDPYGQPYDDPSTPAKDESLPKYKSLNAYGDAIIGVLTPSDKTKIQDWFKQYQNITDNDQSDSGTTTEETEDSSILDLTKDEVLAENISNPSLGYLVNVVSGKNLMNQPYEHVLINAEVSQATLAAMEEEEYDEDGFIIGEYDDGTGDDSLPEAEVNTLGDVSLTSVFYIALKDGNDGTFFEDDDNSSFIATLDGESYTAFRQASNDAAMYRFVKLKAAGVHDEIVESLHYPFTHIFDLGYSFNTKKAMLDFLDVRDDVMVILSTQVLMTDGSGRPIKINDQATDEGNGEALRAYALLMRESVLYGTDCMRCSIYCHSGQLVDSLIYNGVLPFTYWDAVQYSKYGNLTYMKQDEPRGLPNAYNLLFKNWNWWNYRADSQSRVWDNGMNYVQYADMTRLFYPALRTVYRAATSVLVDEWFVAAVVYAKYVVRRAWATFSGRNDPASVLQSLIKKYLDTEIGFLFNGKYAFDVSVYQTAEEQELGYIQHVKLSITSGATMRVLDVDIEVNREGFVPEE